jgi:alpha-tubulin suppressor-like RCC1 family protein
VWRFALVLTGCGRIAFAPTSGDSSDGGPTTTARAVSASWYHSCAIVDGALSCWGKNDVGQLGIGVAGADEPLPRRVDGTWIAVAAGNTFTCAIAIDHTVWCWGDNTDGHLGIGTAGGTQAAPVQVLLDPSPAPIEIAATSAHACARLEDRTVRCWGRNTQGELGRNNTTDGSTPAAPTLADAFDAIAPGYAFTGGLRDGAFYGTGNNASDQLGLGAAAGNQYRVFTAGSAGPYTALASGQDHSIAVAANGTLWGWGVNAQYQLGTGDTVSHDTAIQLDATHVWSRIEADCFTTCGIVEAGALWCWGRTAEGQLGLPFAADPVTAPREVAPFAGVTDVSLGRFHSCLQRDDGTVWCAGSNDSGEIGNGNPGIRAYAWTQITLP